MIVIGITGSIGMGKSTTSNMLREMNIPVHDSDAAVHRLLGENGLAVKAVGKAFPEALAGNHIDRQALGRIVFNDLSKKKVLEEILHPIVIGESEAFKQEMKKDGHPIIALDIPLLFETGGEKRVDVTLCVTAPPETQKDRVLARPGMTLEKFNRIVAEQMPDAEKRKRADYIVDTGKSLDDTRAQLEAIITELKEKT